MIVVLTATLEIGGDQAPAAAAKIAELLPDHNGLVASGFAGVVAVKGLSSAYRVRVGDWRIVYQIEDDVLIVLVLEVAPRGEVYRKLGR